MHHSRLFWRNTLNLSFAALATTVLIFACSSVKKGEDCSQYKSGEFLYHYRGQQGDFYYSINRNDSIQIEINQKTGDTTKWAVHWTDECKYELLLIKSTEHFRDTIHTSWKADPVRNEIVRSTKEYYIFKAESDHTDFVLTDTLWLKK
jgi:hypothetical protein